MRPLTKLRQISKLPREFLSTRTARRIPYLHATNGAMLAPSIMNG
jgi:hypothetical protein